MKKFVFCLLTAALMFCPGIPVQVSAGESLTGEQLATQVFNRNRGEHSISSAVMVLENKKGKKRSRKFTIHRILENGLEKRLLRFTSPADIKGTGFLTIERPGYETEQFLYLPALRRSRRIVSSVKHHKFVNSDFTYEDMERQGVEKYVYRITGDITHNTLNCYILETRPKKTTKSQYSRVISYISKDFFMPQLTRFYDSKGIHIKTYYVLEFKKIQTIWTETRVLMEDVISKHKTCITLDHIDYNTDIAAWQVSKSSLEND